MNKRKLASFKLVHFLVMGFILTVGGISAQSIEETEFIVRAARGEEPEKKPKTHKGQGWVIDMDLFSFHPGFKVGYRTDGRMEYGLLGKFTDDVTSSMIIVGPVASCFLTMSHDKARLYVDGFAGLGLRLIPTAFPEVGNNESLLGAGASLGVLFSGKEFVRGYIEAGFVSSRSSRKEVLNDPLGTTIKSTEYELNPTVTLGFQF